MRDERQVFALGCIHKAERVVGATVAMAAEMILCATEINSGGTRHVRVWRCNQTVNLIRKGAWCWARKYSFFKNSYGDGSSKNGRIRCSYARSDDAFAHTLISI